MNINGWGFAIIALFLIAKYGLRFMIYRGIYRGVRRFMPSKKGDEHDNSNGIEMPVLRHDEN
jgi:hypothetical protein